MATTSDAAPMPPCAHASALMCDPADLHEHNRASIFFFCVECGQFLDDELTPIDCDPLQEEYSSPKSDAGNNPANCNSKGETQKETPGQSQELQNNRLQLAGLQNANGNTSPSNSLPKLLPLDPSTIGKIGKGPGKARKLPEETEVEKYGRVLPGPWDKSPCPNSYKNCRGIMEAFYTLEFEEGNSYMYKCNSCSVITSIAFRESNIHYVDGI